MWLFRFRNYVRFERGLYLRCRQPLYRYAPYAGLDVVPVAVPIARPCAVGDVPDSSRHAPLRDDSHDSRLHGSVSRRRMSDWSRCQWESPRRDIPPMRDIHAGVRRFACSGVRWTRFLQDAANALDGHGPATIVSRHGVRAIAGRRIEKDRAIGARPPIRNHRRRRFSGACRRFAFSGKGSAGAFLIEVRRVMVPP